MVWLEQSLIFKLYIFGFFGSLIAQTFTQSNFGRNSAWGINRGWQNEIAIWNVFAALALLSLVLQEVRSDLVVLALAILSLGFSSNWTAPRGLDS